MSNCNNLGFVLSSGEIDSQCVSSFSPTLTSPFLRSPSSLSRDSSFYHLSRKSQCLLTLVVSFVTHPPRVFAEYRATYVVKRVNNEARFPSFVGIGQRLSVGFKLGYQKGFAERSLKKLTFPTEIKLYISAVDEALAISLPIVKFSINPTAQFSEVS